MNAITIQETLLDCGRAQVVLANDADQRMLMGVSCRDASGPLFVEIDRVTMLELQRGVVDVGRVIAERCAGLAVSA